MHGSYFDHLQARTKRLEMERQQHGVFFIVVYLIHVYHFFNKPTLLMAFQSPLRRTCLQRRRNCYCNFIKTMQERRGLRLDDYPNNQLGMCPQGTKNSIDVDSDVIVIGGGLVGMATAVAFRSQQEQKQQRQHIKHDGVSDCNTMHPKENGHSQSTSFISVQVYEQALALRPVGAAIGLYPNGLSALEYISPKVYDTIQKNAIPSKIFERRDLQNNILKITHVNPKRQKKEYTATRSTVSNIMTTTAAVSPTYYVWYKLQEHFADALPPDTLHLGHCFESFHVDPKTDIITVTFLVRNKSNSTSSTTSTSLEENEQKITIPKRRITRTCRVLIGADGIASAVRAQLFANNDGTSIHRPFQYHGKIMYRAVWNKNNKIGATDAVPSSSSSFTTTTTTRANTTIEYPPKGTQVSYQSDIPGKSFSFRETIPGILTLTAAALAPLPPKSSSSLSLSSPNDHSSPNQKKERLQTLFQEYPVKQILDQIENDSIHEAYIQDIDVEKEWSKGSIVLIGDAAHAMTPHMGQGANQGFEDVCELVHQLLPILSWNGNETQSSNENNYDETNDDTKKIQMISKACHKYGFIRRQRVLPIHSRSRQNSVQSNTFDKNSAATPFERRNYTTSFQDWLYEWTPPLSSSQYES